jgi:hypothetical protein
MTLLRHGCRGRTAGASGTWATVAAWVIAIAVVLLPLPFALQTLSGTLAWAGIVALLVSKLGTIRRTGRPDARTWVVTWAQPMALAVAAIALLMLFATAISRHA